MSRKASGLKAWVIQRVTAIYIAVFSIYLVGALITDAPINYAEWKGWFAGSVMSVATLLFVLSVLMHAWVGVRDVLIDYVWNTSQRLIALSVVATILIACALWATQALVLARLI